jgi:GntR family L-lactate dehydrogenase operon transcriptional regulator
MLTSKEHQEFLILKSMLESEAPLGAGALCHILSESGFDTSEATTGRILREMERHDLLEKVGVRGRTLSERGKKRLEELRHSRTREESAQTFLESLQGEDEEQVVEILMASRAIERETARLAAVRATPEDLRSFKDVIALEEKQLRNDSLIADIDPLFHNLIARTARNRVLMTAVELINQETDLASAFRSVRDRMGQETAADHQKIYRAILAHDPDGAEQAMMDHLDHLIRGVRGYREGL